MEKEKESIVAILGAGMYGTSLAHVASYEKRNKVILFDIAADCVDDINKNHKNSKFHPNIVLNENITATTNIEDAIKNATLVLCCLPVQVIPDVIEKNKQFFNPKVPFCSCSKGMIVSRKQFVSEIVKKNLGDNITFCVLSGPSFAEEIIKDYPTTVVVACANHDAAVLIQKTLSNKHYRVYTHEDVIGVEIAGALKNVYAIGAGIVEGWGFGYNTKTAIIARGSREIQNFVVHYGGQAHTIFGLAGIGDLMLTAFGECSRNRTFGFKLAQGETKEAILASSKGVVEGLPTLQVVRDYIIEHKVFMPILIMIHGLVNGTVTKDEAVEKLMTRHLEAEFEHELTFAQIHHDK